MAERIDRFEDLIAWQRAREMTRAIYYVTRKGTFAKYFGLTNQIQRAAVSVMSNIAEGFERSGMAEFHPRNNEICHAINPDSGLRTLLLLLLCHRNQRCQLLRWRQAGDHPAINDQGRGGFNF
jgi:hypothetical protein